MAQPAVACQSDFHPRIPFACLSNSQVLAIWERKTEKETCPCLILFPLSPAFALASSPMCLFPVSELLEAQNEAEAWRGEGNAKKWDEVKSGATVRC